MPINVNLLRTYKGGDPDKVRRSETKRRNPPSTVDDVIRLDREWVEALQKLEQVAKEKNKIDAEVKASETKRPTDEQRQRSKELSTQKKELEDILEAAAKKREEAILKIGNVLHESVPDYAKEEDFEALVTSWGDFAEKDVIPHHQALWMLGAYEPEKGSAVAGHRGYYLRGPGVLLNQALISYAMSFLIKRGFEPVQPPYFMTKQSMAKVSQLSDFEESLYHVGAIHRGGGETTGEEEGYFLIATSEQPLCCFHQNENLSDMKLPLMYAGYSPCFRKEAGKFGVDTWGIFRVHQFDKVEQFVVTEPDEEVSYAVLEQLRTNAEDFLKSLNLPFKTINVVAGELNLAAAKKYDINAWFPSLKTHKELVSASNCTDYQSRAAETYVTRNNEKKHVHLLNATCCALTRTICCIVENHQGEREVTLPNGDKKVEKGVWVPEVLRPYMNTEFLPFIREPRDFGQQKAATKTEARKKGEAIQKEKEKKKTEDSEETPSSPKKAAAKQEKASAPAGATPRRRSSYKVAGDEFETALPDLAGKNFSSVQEYFSYLNSKSAKTPDQ